MQDPLVFGFVVLAILAAPGPTNALFAAAGATRGFRESLALPPAAAGGYLVTILALGLALGPALDAAPRLDFVLRLGLSVYLLYLAFLLWRRAGAPPTHAAVVTPAQVFGASLLNPKAAAIALAVMPFGDAPIPPYLVGFVAILGVTSSCWIMAGAVLKRWAGDRTALVHRIAAGAVAACSLVPVAGPLLH